METVLIYFIKVNFAIAALYLFFRILFYRDTFFKEKRVALMVSLLFVALHPLLQVTGWFNHPTLTEATMMLSYTLPPIEILAERDTAISWDKLLLLVYAAVSTFFLVRILIQSLQILALTRRLNILHLNELRIVVIPAGSSPYSFFNWVFLNPEEHSQTDLNEILEHERIHIQQHHSIDALLAEVFCAVFWLNPFVWMFKRLLRQNLEFLADNHVLNSGVESKSYQYHLLRLSHQQSINRIGNHFNITDLKQRIIMMNSKKTPLLGLGKYALSLPILAFLIVSTYALSEENQTQSAVSNRLSSMEEPLLSTIQTGATDKTISKSSTEQPMLAAVQTPEVKQVPTRNNGVKVNTTQNVSDKKVPVDVPTVINNADVMPSYPGGETELAKYISANMKYPPSSIELGVSGRVVVRFLVNATGKIQNAEVLRGLDDACDMEALRVVNSMPDWTPGTKEGKKVSVYYTLPLVFKLAR